MEKRLSKNVEVLKVSKSVKVYDNINFDFFRNFSTLLYILSAFENYLVDIII